MLIMAFRNLALDFVEGPEFRGYHLLFHFYNTFVSSTVFIVNLTYNLLAK